MKTHSNPFIRVQWLALSLLILFSITLVSGCRQRSQTDEVAGREPTVTATPTALPTSTVIPTSTRALTASPTESPGSEEAGEETGDVSSGQETAPADPPADSVTEDADEQAAEVVPVTVTLTNAVTNTVSGIGADTVTSVSEAVVETEQPAANEDAVTDPSTTESSTTITPPETVSAPIATASSARPLDDTLNILVLGSDRRPGKPNWRTDVIMIVALDTKTGRAGVISIRDVYVNRPPDGYNSNKINTMDYFGEADHPGGGPELLSAIIEEKMGVPIHHFVRFNFETFQEVVDALGGVEVEIECAFYGDLGGRSKHVKLQLEPGVHRLDGDQAIIYVRSRAVGSDLDRAQRQQRFVWSIRQQALSENILPKLPALYSALSGSVQTDIGLLDAVRLARFVVNLEPADIHAFVVAPPEMLSYGRSRRMTYFYPYWSVIAERAQQIFETEEFVETNAVLNSKGRECK